MDTLKRLQRHGWRGAAVVAVVALAAAGTAAASRLASDGSAKPVAMKMMMMDDSLKARFARLSRAHSNRCGMPASAIYAMAPNARLQGSCCFPMNYEAYVDQIRELKRYRAVALVPKDPYDIPVTLAKRLIAYDKIKLTRSEQRVFDRAKPLSKTKGPCCCPCWRWTAFSGQAKYLISRRHYSAKEIGAIWTVEEGCGGPSDS